MIYLYTRIQPSAPPPQTQHPPRTQSPSTVEPQSNSSHRIFPPSACVPSLTLLFKITSTQTRAHTHTHSLSLSHDIANLQSPQIPRIPCTPHAPLPTPLQDTQIPKYPNTQITPHSFRPHHTLTTASTSTSHPITHPKHQYLKSTHPHPHSHPHPHQNKNISTLKSSPTSQP